MHESSLFSFLVAVGVLCLGIMASVLVVVGYHLCDLLKQFKSSLPELEGFLHETHLTLKRIRKISKRGSRMSKVAEGTLLATCGSILDLVGGVRGIQEIAQTFISGRTGNGHRSSSSRTRQKK